MGPSKLEKRLWKAIKLTTQWTGGTRVRNLRMELGDGEAMPTIESEGAKGGGGCGRGRAGKGEGTADSTPADVSAVQKESQPGPELVPNGTDSQPAPSRGRNNRKPRGGRGGGAVSGEGPGGNENAARPA
eukprot:2741373-Rhodomonas_salina.1